MIKPPKNIDLDGIENRLRRRLSAYERYSLLMYRAFMEKGKSADDMRKRGFGDEYDMASGIMNTAYDLQRH